MNFPLDIPKHKAKDPIRCDNPLDKAMSCKNNSTVLFLVEKVKVEDWKEIDKKVNKKVFEHFYGEIIVRKRFCFSHIFSVRDALYWR